MTAGRPTDYNKSILEKSNNYIENYKDHNDMIPSVEGLVRVLGIARSTAYRWADEEGKEEFKDILENLNAAQARTLINKGLSGEFNANITKLVLGKHGFSEKQSISAAVTEISHEEWLDGLDG